MKKELGILGVATLGAFALHSAPAAAQAKANSQEVHVYAGELFGDDLTNRPVSGATPRLDDNAIYGARYDYYFTDVWGIELAAGYSPGRATRVASGNTNLDLTTVDVDAVWNFTPQARIVGYTVAGLGYAHAKLDHNLAGLVNQQFVSVTDDDSFTANAGIGAKFYATDNFIIRLEGRYRYLNKLVSPYDRNLNTVETTLGVGWRF